MPAQFEVYRDALGKYRWRLLSGNDRVIAKGGESYESRTAAVSAISAVRASSDVPLDDSTDHESSHRSEAERTTSARVG